MAFNVYYCGQKTSALTLADSGKNLYRKELIYAGSFLKKTNSDKQEFSVDAELLQHWHDTFNLMLSNGVEVPVPATHTTNPDAKRGILIKTELAKNSNGVDALFGYIQFNDKQTAEQNRNNNVSIYVPVDKTDGKGNKYDYPITHVALTDYPVIPGLSKFELVASFDNGTEKKMDKLATLLGVDPAAPDLEAALQTAIQDLLDKVAKLDNPPTPKPDDKVPPKPDEKALSLSMAKTMSNMVCNARNATIDSLTGEYLNPAAAKELKSQFCNNESVALSLSTDGESNDVAFDSVIKMVKANGKIRTLKEKTGPQLPDGLELSGADLISSEKNPLLASADRIAKEFASRQ